MKNSYIGIMAENTSTLLVGLLGILKSGNCLVPINPTFPDDRIGFILEDCRIKVLLADKTNYTKARQVARKTTCLKHVLCIDENDFERVGSGSGRIPEYKREELHPDQPCYVIYTSGSTGEPKGVQVSHRNLVPLLLWFHEYFKLGEHIRVLQNLSYTFDFGIFELITTLLAGGILCFSDQQAADLNEYMDFILRHRINTVHTTPSFFTNIIDLGRSLSTLKLVHFGGERLAGKVVEDLSRLVGEESYIHNGYGPTETTINTTIFSLRVGALSKPGIPADIPIGKPTANNSVFILDAYGNLQPVGVAGELYIGGSGVAEGYLNRPELTAEKFVRTVISHSSLVNKNSKRAVNSHSSLVISSSNLSPNDQCPMTNDSFSNLSPNDQCPMTNDRLYRSGDLGCWLPDGNIEFLGRIDQQVKIRGFRIELGEIENQLLCYDGVGEARVIPREDNQGERYLCAYIVLKGGSPGKRPGKLEMREYLAKKLPDYMIPSYFVYLEKMPLIPGGKVDIKALPEPGLEAEDLQYTAPRHEVEEKLVKIWLDVLNIDGRQESYDIEEQTLSIGIDANFFELGGHSLKAIILGSKIHKEFSVKIPLETIFETPTIRGLGEYIENCSENKFVSLPVVEKKEYYPLSSAQKRLYFLHYMDTGCTHYNMPHILTLREDIDEERLEKTFKKLISRHESLRTSFAFINEEPVQRIHDNVEFQVEYVQFTRVEKQKTVNRLKEMIGNFESPFDLSKAPLVRVKLIQTGERGILFVDMHHIVTDGTSQEILTKEFMIFYSGGHLAPLKLQYKDYTEWQNKNINSEEMKRQEQYWLEKFKGELPLLNLPIDYPRPPFQSFAGGIIFFEIDEKLTKKMKMLEAETETTIYIILLSIFNVLLFKLTEQGDILVGTPVVGRTHSDLNDVIGFFVNMLAMRNFPDGNKTYKDFLMEVKENALDAYENQDYQFENLVEKLHFKREPGRHALIDAVILLQNQDEPIAENGGYNNIESAEGSMVNDLLKKKGVFDLYIGAVEARTKICLHLIYAASIFKRETMVEFSQSYIEILNQVLETPGIQLKSIKVLKSFITAKSKSLKDLEFEF